MEDITTLISSMEKIGLSLMILESQKYPDTKLDNMDLTIKPLVAQMHTYYSTETSKPSKI